MNEFCAQIYMILDSNFPSQEIPLFLSVFCPHDVTLEASSHSIWTGINHTKPLRKDPGMS